jgi:AcrR family transcriptional regulator
MPPNSDPILGSVWIRPSKARRGQPSLSREQIVTAAIELLDADGLEGLSMRRLGTKLGSGATSIYWYVTNKDELLELAMDEVMGEVSIPEPGDEGWRTVVTALAHGFRDMILAHPWLIGLIGTRPAIGPNSMRLSERMIGVLTATGFTGANLPYASSLVLSYVTGAATYESGMRTLLDQTGKNMRELVDELEPHIERNIADYPTYSEWWQESRTMDVERLQRDSFGFGLERLLDGLELWLDQGREHK